MASEVAAAAANVVRRAGKEMHGIVVSAGLMDKTVKVKLGGLRWEPRVQKFFKEPRFKLVHDPANSVRQGDVIAIQPSWRVSKHVRHVVKHIIAPYGPPIEDRPSVPTLEERVAKRADKRAAKLERRALRREEQAREAAEEREAALEEKRKRLEEKERERERLKGIETSLSDVD
ncbi:nucleic acid-binding protein [Daldinia decipiens]|uniref:nucleic acid-binding protein n=1 Tax=Daldinia decipiens TaxID=326647 RepID=UPI0020C3B4F4|nr:nucleic acid-binding protein [Daldinia decipiens]KAI1656127.1 nucleic acid-binding protein [Daldinia decipiens]